MSDLTLLQENRRSPDDISAGEARKLVDAIQLPAQPEVVCALMRERLSEDPDLRRLAELIGRDVGLAAAVLKSVNAPFFGLRRKVGNIPEAVSLLGLNNIGALAMALSLRASVAEGVMSSFWESSQRAAQLAHMLARELCLGNQDDAHLYVLFHDSAMPILAKRLAGYDKTMESIALTGWVEITRIEDARHHTNHAVVGGLLAQNWGLPRVIRDAITLHHDPLVFGSESIAPEVKTLIALGHVAEKVEESLSRRFNDCAWEAFGKTSLDYLMMGESEMQDFLDMAHDRFEGA